MKQAMKLGIGILIFSLTVFLWLPQAAEAYNGRNNLAENVRSKIQVYYDQNFQVTDNAEGKVTINGQVKTLYDKLRIFEIASAVPGVREIEDNLYVDTPIVPDDIIQTNVAEELKYNGSILEPDRIKVHVDNGIVFLNGTVSFFREKLEAETVASWQKGVKGIDNELTVLPPQKVVSDSNLTNILQELLKNKFSLNKEVSFTVNDGTVTLNGKAASLWDKNEIQKEFSRILGVKKVVNNLGVVEDF